MKNLKFVFSATAMLAVSVLFTSCWRASEDRPTKTETTTVEVQQTYQLVVSANVTAKFEVTGKAAVTNTAAQFSDITAKTVKVKATATDAAYTIPSNSQEMEVTFSDDQTSAVVEFTFAKESAVQVEQAEAKGTTVTNDTENAAEFGKVEVTVPATVNITGNTTDPFSVVAFKPAEEPKFEENTAEVPALTLKCEPDGAQFDPALDVKAYVGIEAAGMQVTINDTEYTVDAEGYVTYKAGHFSLWGVLLKLFTSEENSGTVEIYNNPDFVFAQGENTVSYNQFFGWGVEAGDATGVVKYVLNSLYGIDLISLPKSATFTAQAAGNGSVRAIQHYTDHRITSGNRVITIRVYGKVELEVTASETVAPEGHSGGGGQ